jgi:hypothetical protein
MPELRLSELAGPANAAFIAVMRDRLLESVDDFKLRSGVSSTQFCVAVEETLANAFYHGNLELDSSLKQSASSTFNELVRQRCTQSPWKDRCVCVTEVATPCGIWGIVRDEGSGYDSAAALSRDPDPYSFTESGRGLVMMKAFSDEMFFNESGNEVTLVFYPDGQRNINRSTDQRPHALACESLQ